MKIKTFVAENPTQLDELVNAFEENNDVKATQTDTFVMDNRLYHKAVVFYKAN